MLKIVIIGAGELGSRHLQAVSKISESCEIFVVEPNTDSYKKAITRFNEVNKNTYHIIHPSNTIDMLPKDIDFAILATNADVRCSILLKLITKLSIKYYIIEKVLFQSLDEYCEIEKLIEEKNIVAWVNCPRRVYPFYKELKSQTRSKAIRHMSVIGSNWGFASNSIHFIDLAAFLIDNYDYKVNYLNIYEGPYEAKRKGFYDFHASMHIEFENGATLNIKSIPNAKLPFFVNIYFDDIIYFIRDWEGKYIIQNMDKEVFIGEYNVPYQSQLTNEIIEEILCNGDSSLTTLKKSIQLHKPFISKLLTKVNKNNNIWNKCLIT